MCGQRLFIACERKGLQIACTARTEKHHWARLPTERVYIDQDAVFSEQQTQLVRYEVFIISWSRCRREVAIQIAVAVTGAAFICETVGDWHKRELASNDFQLSASEFLQDPLDGY